MVEKLYLSKANMVSNWMYECLGEFKNPFQPWDSKTLYVFVSFSLSFIIYKMRRWVYLIGGPLCHLTKTSDPYLTLQSSLPQSMGLENQTYICSYANSDKLSDFSRA